jgi:hypothetical protein
MYPGTWYLLVLQPVLMIVQQTKVPRLSDDQQTTDDCATNKRSKDFRLDGRGIIMYSIIT